MRGPTSPVCREGTPCTEPASGAMLNFARVGPGHMQTITVGGVPGAVGAGALVAKDGTYSVSLAPGIYTVDWVYISSVPSHVGRRIVPSTVLVDPGQNRRVDFRIDTGIR
jgi:hypothetical protein